MILNELSILVISGRCWPFLWLDSRTFDLFLLIILIAIALERLLWLDLIRSLNHLIFLRRFLLLKHSVFVMVIALLLRHALNFIFQIFRICHFQFLIICDHILLWVPLICQNFIGEKNFMQDSVKHPCSEKTREVLFILLWRSARKDPYEFSWSIELYSSLI